MLSKQPKSQHTSELLVTKNFQSCHTDFTSVKTRQFKSVKSIKILKKLLVTVAARNDPKIKSLFFLLAGPPDLTTILLIGKDSQDIVK